MRLPESWSSTFSGNQAVRNHCTEKVCLDNAFVLIEGRPFIMRGPAFELEFRVPHLSCRVTGGVFDLDVFIET